MGHVVGYGTASKSHLASNGDWSGDFSPMSVSSLRIIPVFGHTLRFLPQSTHETLDVGQTKVRTGHSSTGVFGVALQDMHQLDVGWDCFGKLTDTDPP
mmetsp:Transcript_94390/g.163161  ORF Transcript_94390/g.163161 Transcript_94390/m.163161 type:complete len:98 (+) Transcript_94390:132-425(+)